MNYPNCRISPEKKKKIEQMNSAQIQMYGSSLPISKFQHFNTLNQMTAYTFIASISHH